MEMLAELDAGNAMTNKKMAVDYYEKDDCTSKANKLKYDIANELALSDDPINIQESICIYSSLAMYYIDNKSLIWKVSDCCFRSGLCYLKLGDMTDIWLTRYQSMYPIFANTYHCKFLQSVIQSPDEFTIHVRDLDD